jgi:hypothetical protein
MLGVAGRIQSVGLVTFVTIQGEAGTIAMNADDVAAIAVAVGLSVPWLLCIALGASSLVQYVSVQTSLLHTISL